MTTTSDPRQCLSSKACLTDLPEELLASILKHQPLKTKCQAQAVCRMFRDILCKPSQGISVWDSILLDDPILAAVSPAALVRQALSLLQARACTMTELGDLHIEQHGVTAHLTCRWLTELLKQACYRIPTLMLCSWLNRRVWDISSLHYEPGAKRSASQPAAVLNMRREYQEYTEVLPEIAAILPHAAEIQLNLGYGEV